MGTLNMLGLAKRVGARFLLTSTSEVYGDPLEHPQKESYWGHVNPIGVLSLTYLRSMPHLSLSSPIQCDIPRYVIIMQVLGAVMMRGREQLKLLPWITTVVLVSR